MRVYMLRTRMLRSKELLIKASTVRKLLAHFARSILVRVAIGGAAIPLVDSCDSNTATGLTCQSYT